MDRQTNKTLAGLTSNAFMSVEKESNCTQSGEKDQSKRPSSLLQQHAVRVPRVRAPFGIPHTAVKTKPKKSDIKGPPVMLFRYILGGKTENLHPCLFCGGIM